MQTGESFASLYHDDELSMTSRAADHAAKEETLLSDCNDIEKASGRQTSERDTI